MQYDLRDIRGAAAAANRAQNQAALAFAKWLHVFWHDLHPELNCAYCCL